MRLDPDKALSKSTWMVRVGYCVVLAFGLVNYALVAIALGSVPPVLAVIPQYCLLITVFAVIACYYFGWRHPDNWLSGVVLLALGALVIIQVWDFFFSDLDGLMAFWPVTVLAWHLGVILLLAGLWIPVHLVILAIHCRHQGGRGDRETWWGKVREKPVREALLLVGLVGTGVAIGVVEAEILPPAESVTITPRDYPVEFAFWARLNPSWYSAEEKEALDRHAALLIPYDVPVWYEADAATRAMFVSWCQYWKTHYSRVRIMPVVHGVPGRFVWDGSAEGSIRFAYRIIDAVLEHNLTNVIGLNTDQEKPHGDDVLDDDKFKSWDRNARADALWAEFFDHVNATWPNRFEFQTTFGMKSMIDQFDGDRDLDVYVRNNVLSLEGWDEFAPMIYVGEDTNYLPGVLDATPYHYELYHEMAILHAALARHGWEDRIGVYVGITNMSIFGNATRHIFNGVEGTGFDALVTQGLIAKHFGCARLTIFILSTEESGDEGEWMGGVFDSYGPDFLDAYNTSINGPGATTPFSVGVTGPTSGMDKLQLDYWLNALTPAWFAALFVAALLSQVVLVKRKARA